VPGTEFQLSQIVAQNMGTFAEVLSFFQTVMGKGLDEILKGGIGNRKVTAEESIDCLFGAICGP
jgi:hypothetical protein